MPDYKYKAITSTGAKIEGIHNCDNKDDVAEFLRKNKEFPISIEEVKEGSTKITILDMSAKVKSKDISVFCRQFFTMLNAGVPILSCLDILRVQTDNKKLRVTIGIVYDEVQKGRSLSESMGDRPDIFPELLINMVAAGELSGTLDIIMSRMATHFEKENKITNKVKSAMVYPLVLAVVATAVVIFLMAFVVPNFVSMFASAGVILPLPTRIMLALSNIIVKYGIYILAGTAIIVFALNRFFSTDRGKTLSDTAKLKIPVVKDVTKKLYTARFARTLSTLMGSGIPLIQALEIVSKVVQHKLVEKGIIAAIEDVKKGVSLSVPIKSMNLFPPMLYHMINIGEESGSLDDILERTADYYDEEVDTAIQRMTALMEPLMILVMAVVAGSIVISIVLPMFDMMKTVT